MNKVEGLIPPPFQQTANPVIVSSVGYTDGSESVALILFANTGGRGYVRLRGSGDNGSSNDIINCYTTKVAIVHLEELHIPGIQNKIDLSAYRCRDEISQNCDASPPTCSNEIESGNPQSANVHPLDPTIPNSPGPLKITPGSTILNVEWTPVTNTDVFAYSIRAFLNETEAKSGFVQSTFSNIVIPQLANDREYTVEVFALSSSNVKGEVASGTGTPTRNLIPGEILPGPSRAPANLPITPTPVITKSTIVANITDSDGNPISGASVLIDGSLVGMTDKSGGIVIENISPGVHTYNIKAEGFNDVYQETGIAPGVTYVSIQMIPGGVPATRGPLTIIPLNNKNNEKIISLELMQKMSIEDIVNLYKNGFSIELVSPLYENSENIKKLQTIDAIPDKYLIYGLGIYAIITSILLLTR